MQTISANRLWKKLKQVKGTKEVTVKALLLFVVLNDAHTPVWIKGALIVALAYLINPADPFGIDPLILVDDIAVLSSAITAASTAIKPCHHHQATLEYHKL